MWAKANTADEPNMVQEFIRYDEKSRKAAGATAMGKGMAHIGENSRAGGIPSVKYRAHES